MKRIETILLTLAIGTTAWLGACGSSSSGGGAGNGGGGGGGGGGSSAPSFTVQPALTPNPNPAAPLVASITATTDELTTMRLLLDDGQVTTTLRPNPGFALSHQMLVLGLKTNRNYTIQVEATDIDGNVTTAPTAVTITTPAPPAPFYPFEVSVSNPIMMEPGVTMFVPEWAGGPAGFEPDPSCTGLIVMIDETGEIVWYYCAPHVIGDLRRLNNGNLLYITGRRGAVEIDMLGDVQRSWVATGLLEEDGQGGWILPEDEKIPAGALPVETDTMHHELLQLPISAGGNFVVLSSELREYPNYPNSEIDPTSTDPIGKVIGDVIVEFSADGTVVSELRLLDVLDPYRMSYDALGGFWNPPAFYGPGTRDWTHCNGMDYDASDDCYVVSVRHQDVVLKVSRATKKAIWLLGDHARWESPWNALLLAPQTDELFALQGTERRLHSEFGSFAWPYHTHAPEVTPSGTILLFDNGNGRAIPPTPQLPLAEQYSRAAEFSVDAQNLRVTGVWRYGGPEDPWFSRFISDADRQPITGNVLVTDGGKSIDGSGSTQGFARLVEVTHTIPPQIVWEMTIRDPNPDTSTTFAWFVYRSERLPSVYP